MCPHRSVTLIQRFGGALNLNVHVPVLFLDGVYVDSANGSGPLFRWVKAPTSAELTQLTHTIAQRVGRYLEHQGLLERRAKNSFLAGCGPREHIVRTAAMRLPPGSCAPIANVSSWHKAPVRCNRLKRTVVSMMADATHTVVFPSRPGTHDNESSTQSFSHTAHPGAVVSTAGAVSRQRANANRIL